MLKMQQEELPKVPDPARIRSRQTKRRPIGGLFALPVKSPQSVFSTTLSVMTAVPSPSFAIAIPLPGAVLFHKTHRNAAARVRSVSDGRQAASRRAPGRIIGWLGMIAEHPQGKSKRHSRADLIDGMNRW